MIIFECEMCPKFHNNTCNTTRECNVKENIRKKIIKTFPSIKKEIEKELSGV